MLWETFHLGPTTTGQYVPTVRRFRTYVLDNATTLPSVPIHDLTEATPVVEPTLRILERCSQWGDVLRPPYRRENIPRAIEALVGCKSVDAHP